GPASVKRATTGARRHASPPPPAQRSIRPRTSRARFESGERVPLRASPSPCVSLPATLSAAVQHGGMPSYARFQARGRRPAGRRAILHFARQQLLPAVLEPAFRPRLLG